MKIKRFFKNHAETQTPTPPPMPEVEPPMPKVEPLRKVGIKTILKEGNLLYKDYFRIKEEVESEEYICPYCGDKAEYETSLFYDYKLLSHRFCCNHCNTIYSVTAEDEQAEIERRYAEFEASMEAKNGEN